MPESAVIGQFERRLLELGCPATQARDKARELAWVGTDSRLPQPPPLLAARICRTTFPNPQPGVEIASLDYVSTLTAAAPFLAGLTLEK